MSVNGGPARRGAVAVDIGGTFTDLAAVLPDGRVHTHKLLTTTDPAVGFMDAVRELLRATELAPAQIDEVLHATTLGSNLVLQRAGPSIGLLVTRGFRDVLEIGRSLRYSMYDVQIEKPTPMLPRSRTWEVDERVSATGEMIRELDVAQVRAIAAELRAASVTSVAIAFMHSYAHPGNERLAAAILREAYPELLVTVSSDVSSQAREYERANTAVVNAYIAPILGDYLSRLSGHLRSIGIDAPLWVMQSSGGLASAQLAATFAVRTVESGPAAGVLMAATIARRLGSDVISFDMGGTTAKAAVVMGGAPLITHELELDRREMREGSGLPVNIPACDLVEIGAGGGSIASVEFGVLKVGPRSAGADPGPACYGRGGTEPTVTDANVVLGYLDPAYFARGQIELDRGASVAALAGLGTKLGLDPLQTAWAVYELITFEMEKALRLVSIDRGLDTRDFAMVCFGGAGPAHGSRLARSLGIRKVMIPSAAGVGSAIGLLHATESAELALTRPTGLRDDGAAGQIATVFADLERQAAELVASDGREFAPHRSVGVRYRGQGGELRLMLPDAPSPQAIETAFHDRYERRYGAAEDLQVEAITWYLQLRRIDTAVERPLVHDWSSGSSARSHEREIYMPETGLLSIQPVRHESLHPGDVVRGPAIVEEAHTTTVLLPGDAATVLEDGALSIEIPVE